MNRTILTPLLIISFLFLGACASSYQIHSTPEGASVFFNDPEQKDPVMLGTTPLFYSKSALPDEKVFSITLKKPGYHSQDVPMASTDESKTVVNVALKADDLDATPQGKEFNRTVRSLFKAQQLIYERQFHAAIIQLDELLRQHNDLAQAYVMKGTSYFLLNEQTAAVNAWQAALKLDPENSELIRFLEDKKISLKDRIPAKVKETAEPETKP